MLSYYLLPEQTWQHSGRSHLNIKSSNSSEGSLALFFFGNNFFLTFLLKSITAKASENSIHVWEGVYRGTELLAYYIICLEGLIRGFVN